MVVINHHAKSYVLVSSEVHPTAHPVRVWNIIKKTRVDRSKHVVCQLKDRCERTKAETQDKQKLRSK